MGKPFISIGIVTYNEAHQILQLLEQIEALCSKVCSHVLIVDNGSSDQTLAIAGIWAKQTAVLDVHIFQNSENSMATARNMILKNASSEWVYFTDADCRLQPHAWQKILEKIQSVHKHESIAGIGGSACPPPQRNFVYDGLHSMRKNWLGHMNSIQIQSPAHETSVSQLSTCNLAVLREAALKVGGCDARFIRAGEDLSLSHRLKKNNYVLVALPSAEVLHLQRTELKNWYHKMFRYGYAQTHMAWIYPDFFMGHKGLQFLAILLAFIGSFIAPTITLVFAASYIILLLFVFKNAVSVIFIFTSQMVYAWGEIYGFIDVPLKRKNRPTKIPSLEKK